MVLFLSFWGNLHPAQRQRYNLAFIIKTVINKFITKNYYNLF